MRKGFGACQGAQSCVFYQLDDQKEHLSILAKLQGDEWTLCLGEEPAASSKENAKDTKRLDLTDLSHPECVSFQKGEIVRTSATHTIAIITNAATASATPSTNISTICCPVLGNRDEVLGILRIEKPAAMEFGHFELLMLETLCSCAGIALQRSVIMDQLLNFSLRQRQLLSMAQEAYAKNSLSEMRDRIQRAMIEMIGCQVCRLYCVSLAQDDELEESIHRWGDSDTSMKPEDCFPKNMGVTSWAITTGTTVMLKDAKAHPQYVEGLDSFEGHSSPFLCVPIVDAAKKVRGAIQLLGQPTGFFSREQVDIVEEWAAMLSFHLERRIELRRQCLERKHDIRTLEMLISERLFTEREWKDFQAIVIPPAKHTSMLHMDTIHFQLNPQSFPQNSMVDIGKADASTHTLLRMFMDLEFVQTYQIPHDRLCKFVLALRRSFARHPYRTWAHTLQSCHFLYLCWTNTKLRSVSWLPDIELFGLFLAVLCKDLIMPSKCFEGVVHT